MTVSAILIYVAAGALCRGDTHCGSSNSSLSPRAYCVLLFAGAGARPKRTFVEIFRRRAEGNVPMNRVRYFVTRIPWRISGKVARAGGARPIVNRVRAAR